MCIPRERKLTWSLYAVMHIHRRFVLTNRWLQVLEVEGWLLLEARRLIGCLVSFALKSWFLNDRSISQDHCARAFLFFAYTCHTWVLYACSTSNKTSPSRHIWSGTKRVIQVHWLPIRSLTTAIRSVFRCETLLRVKETLHASPKMDIALHFSVVDNTRTKLRIRCELSNLKSGIAWFSAILIPSFYNLIFRILPPGSSFDLLLD